MIAGQSYSVDSTAGWYVSSQPTANGSVTYTRLGAVVSLVFPSPTTVTGTWTLLDVQGSSYTPNSFQSTIGNATGIDVSVDLNTNRVVGVDPTGVNLTSTNTPASLQTSTPFSD